MNYKNIKIEKRGNYAIIQIANNKNNSLDEKTLNEIANATKHLNKTKEIKCIGLIGGSKFFSPGADINCPGLKASTVADNRLVPSAAMTATTTATIMAAYLPQRGWS